jgi:pyruvate,orthophosphate dikinase
LNLITKHLEIEFKDLQDFEFTVQERNLFILQTRNGKRTPWAALQIAFDMVNEGLIDKQTALNRLIEYDLQNITRTKIIFESESSRLASYMGHGLPASPGVAVGEIVFDSETAKKIATVGTNVILIRNDISTEDIEGMAVSQGILTKTGGKTSHASVVSRQMNKVCIVGCNSLEIDKDRGKCYFGNRILYERELVSLDGNNGDIYQGKVNFEIERPENMLSSIEDWKKEL